MSKQRITVFLESIRDEIISGYRMGESIDNLARKYQCSNTPIRQFLLRHSVQLRPPIRQRGLIRVSDELLRLYHAGANTRELAKRFSVDRNTVSQFIASKGELRNVSISKRSFFIKRKEDRAMLAGLLLGEGSIIIRERSVAIRIVNQDTSILGWLAQFGGKIYWSKPRERCPNPCGIWDVGCTVNVFHCLLAVFPYLVGKKQSFARAALKILKNNYGLTETL